MRRRERSTGINRMNTLHSLARPEIRPLQLTSARAGYRRSPACTPKRSPVRPSATTPLGLNTLS